MNKKLDNITLPATIPGLIRRGSPVVVLRDQYISGGLWMAAGVVVKVHAHSDSDASAYVGFEEVRERRLIHPRVLTLDLSDATGRVHAAWWLAGRPGPQFVRDCDGWRRWCLSGTYEDDTCADMAWWGIGKEQRVMGLVPGPYESWVDCPPLDDLDGDDPTTLPDGSLRVDAEALRRVVLYVAGCREGGS